MKTGSFIVVDSDTLNEFQNLAKKRHFVRVGTWLAACWIFKSSFGLSFPDVPELFGLLGMDHIHGL